MKGGGIIVRLIDIVMLLLMGFLLISDIVKKAEIKLPSGRKKRTSQTQPKEITRIRIHVVKRDTTIDSLRTNETPKRLLSQSHTVYKILEPEKAYQVRSLDLLDDKFLSFIKNYDSLLIIITPDSNSIVQGTINLIDVCRKFRVKKMFDYPY